MSSLISYDERTPNRFLALERGFAFGVGTKGRVYKFSTAGASNVLYQHSLTDAPFRPVRKTLLFDLDDIGVARTDNVEGITWGPPLPSGERTLLIVSDNNFSQNQRTQIIAIAVP
ncbi:MAG: esterase-like activity of phytase family protein [Pseudonocardiaceae bacterium]